MSPGWLSGGVSCGLLGVSFGFDELSEGVLEGELLGELEGDSEGDPLGAALGEPDSTSPALAGLA